MNTSSTCPKQAEEAHSKGETREILAKAGKRRKNNQTGKTTEEQDQKGGKNMNGGLSGRKTLTLVQREGDHSHQWSLSEQWEGKGCQR